MEVINYNLLYRVGNNKLYKTYYHGSFRDLGHIFDGLRERAANKSFIMRRRSQGNMGVRITYTKGEESVQFLICTDEQLNFWWSDKVAK